jgi:hypothetical protein
MAKFTFRNENQINNENASRIEKKAWKLHESTIRSLHAERKSRKEILYSLATKHDFPLTKGQLNAQMRKRGLKVYGLKKLESIFSANLDDTRSSISSAEDSRGRGFETDIGLKIPDIAKLVERSPLSSESHDNIDMCDPLPDSTSKIFAPSDVPLDFSIYGSSTFVETSLSFHIMEDEPVGRNSSERRGRQNQRGEDMAAVKILDGAFEGGEVVDSFDGMDFDSILPEKGNKKKSGSRSLSRSRSLVRREWRALAVCNFVDTSFDPMMTCAQSDTSSVKAFHTMTFRGKSLTSASVYSGDHSIISSDTHESWDFERVTGMPKDPLRVPEHYILWSFEKQCDTWTDGRIFLLSRPKEELAKRTSNGRDKAGALRDLLARQKIRKV